MSVDWEEGMSVGVEEIDVHHRQILRRVRHLAGAVTNGRVRELRSALNFLHGYLSEHHATEERWMEDAGYPASQEHARAHGAMVERIRAAREDAGAGADGRLLAAAEWLARTLDEHMRVDDLKLGRFWTARQNLRLLAENGPGVGVSLTPLPGTFRAVSPDAPAEDGAPEPTPRPVAGAWK